MEDKTPLEVKLEQDLEELDRTFKMELRLRKFAQKIPGGYLLSAWDLRKFFEAEEKEIKNE